MRQTPENSKGDTFTFRLDPDLKSSLAQAAADARTSPAELVRVLVRAHLAGRERRAFHAEARRQSLAIARRAVDPASDEARVMAEIDSDLDAISESWKA